MDSGRYSNLTPFCVSLVTKCSNCFSNKLNVGLDVGLDSQQFFINKYLQKINQHNYHVKFVYEKT